MPKVTEREITFAVESTWSMPDLAEWLADGQRLESAEADLSATYLDTESATLRRLGITLRRRSGGDDAGWHLKVPAGNARTEFQSLSPTSEPPETLTDRIHGLVAGQDLREVAVIDTHRRISRVLDADDQLVLEVADDTVRTATMGSQSRLDNWREVEVELGPAGDEAWLRKATKHLTRHGATARGVTVKLNRALGTEDGADARPAVRHGLAALVADYLVEQAREVLHGDVALREQPEAVRVHRTRVAIRRIRSTLRVFAPMIDQRADVIADLDADLRWSAGLLGPIRDADILRRNLERQLDGVPTEQLLGPVRRQIAETLATDRSAAVQEWRAGLNDARYARVMTTLASWLVRPPVLDVKADGRRFLGKAARTVERRLETANGDLIRLHAARKAAKRLRYTADLLGSSTPKAIKTAKRAKKLQTVLGHHQDDVVAMDFLMRLSREGAAEGRNGFTYGLLLGAIHRDAADLRRQLARWTRPGRDVLDEVNPGRS